MFKNVAEVQQTVGVCERRDVIKRKRLSQGASNTC